MKPRYRLRFHLFDGKTQMWWVTTERQVWTRRGWDTIAYSTYGYVDPARAVFEAARL